MTDGATSPEELLRFLYLMPVGVAQFRAGGRVDLINPVASALLLSIATDASLHDMYLALAPIAPDLRQRVAAFGARSGCIVARPRLRATAGNAAIVLSLTVTRVDADLYMAVLADVTHVATAEQRLYADERTFFAIFDHVRDYAIYTITIDGHIRDWNHSLERYGGWLPADLAGRTVEIFFPHDDPDRPNVAALLDEVRRVGSVETNGWRNKRDGSRLWASSVFTALPDESGAIDGFVVVSRDITERKRLDDRLEHLATVDPLTGAYNRRAGDAVLATEFTRRDRLGAPFALLMLDIDDFKSINDRYGHQAGDAVLRTLVKTIRGVLRGIDVIVRWGGEEFLIVLPGSDAAAGVGAADRVRAAAAAMGVPAEDGSVIACTISIGVAVPAGDSATELLRRADGALYAAKTAGRNRVELAT